MNTGKSLGLTSLVALLIVGCATRADVMKDGPVRTYSSSLAPLKLAACIDRNADDYALGSLRSKIVDPTALPIEISIMNGATHLAIVHVTPAHDGSVATFHLGGMGSIAPDSVTHDMTVGCGGRPVQSS